MSDETALVVAYGVIWGFLFLYVVRLGRAFRTLRADARELRERLDHGQDIDRRM